MGRFRQSTLLQLQGVFHGVRSDRRHREATVADLSIVHPPSGLLGVDGDEPCVIQAGRDIPVTASDVDLVSGRRRARRPSITRGLEAVASRDQVALVAVPVPDGKPGRT